MGRLSKRIFLLAVVLTPPVIYIAIWFGVHAVPTESMARAFFERASRLEIVLVEAEKPATPLAVPDAKLWETWRQQLRFRSPFWKISEAPERSLGLHVFEGDAKEPSFVMDLREDGHVHLRKGRRWFRMPVDPDFEKSVREHLLTLQARDESERSLEAKGKPQ